MFFSSESNRTHYSFSIQPSCTKRYWSIVAGCLLFVTLCSLPLFAFARSSQEERTRLVIGPFQLRHFPLETSSWVSGVSDLLTIELSEAKRFVVLDRSAVSSMIDEVILAQQGSLKNYDIDKISKLDRPDFILAGKQYKADKTGILAAKIYDVDKGIILASRRFNATADSFIPTVQEIESLLENAVAQKAKPTPKFLVAINGFTDLSTSDAYLHYGDQIQEFLTEKFLGHPNFGLVARSQMDSLLQEQRLKEIVLVQAGQRIAPLPNASLVIRGSYKVTPGASLPIEMNVQFEAPGYLIKEIALKATSYFDCQALVEQVIDELLIVQAKLKGNTDQHGVREAIDAGLKLTGPCLANISSTLDIDILMIGVTYQNGQPHSVSGKDQRTTIIQEAIRQFEKALELEPTNDEAMLFLGLCLLRKEIHRPDESKHYLEKVVLGSTNGRYKEIAARFIPSSSDIFIENFPKDLEIPPESKSHLYDGMKRGDFSFHGIGEHGIDKEFPPRISSPLFEKRRSAKEKRSNSYRHDTKNLQEAIDNFEAALFLDPRNFKATLLLASCLRDPAIGERDRAEQLFRRVVQFSKNEEYKFLSAEALDILDKVPFSPLISGEISSRNLISKNKTKDTLEGIVKPQQARSPAGKERSNKTTETRASELNSECGQCQSLKKRGPEDPPNVKATSTVYPNTRIQSEDIDLARHNGSQSEPQESIKATKMYGPELELFGKLTIATSGNYLVAGGGNVFSKKDDKWIPVIQLASDSPKTNDQFGHAVAMSGDSILIGAPGDDAEGTLNKKDFNNIAVDIESLFEKLFQRGYLDVYNGITGKVQEHKHLSDLIALLEKDFPEYSSSIQWNIAKILTASNTVKRSGSVYFFIRESDEWVAKQKITAFDATVDNGFGYTVAVGGDFLFIGAYGFLSPVTWQFTGGGVYVYQLIDGQFQFQKKFIEGRIDALSITDDIAVISYQQLQKMQLLASQVLVYQRQQQDWIFKTELRPSDYVEQGDSFAQYGISLSTDGKYVAVGNPWDNLGNRTNGRRGSTYIFQRTNDLWLEQQKLTFTQPGTNFGKSVAIANGRLLAGADLKLTNNTCGTTVLYELSDGVWTAKQHYLLTDTKLLDNFSAGVLLTKHHAIMTDESRGSASLKGALYYFPLGE